MAESFTVAAPSAGIGTEPAVPSMSAAKFIEFVLCGRRCLIEAERVLEIVFPLPTAAVPGNPPWLQGLAAHRGEPIAVIEPALVLHFDEIRGGKRSKLLIFRKEDGQCRFALPVESVNKLVAIEADQLRPVDPLDTKAVACECEYGSSSVILIDSKRLTDSLEHFRNRTSAIESQR